MPIAIPTAETVQFIRRHAPPGASVLEIGCGAGDVAASLQRLGYSVTGIDADEQQVELARAKGVHAIHGHWPLAVPPADVIVFTRSLHHIHDLDGAIRAARENGAKRLLIEDFDFYAANEATVQWLVTKVQEATARGIVRDHVDEFALRVAAAADPLSAWRHDHDHDLHRADAMRDAVARQFVIDGSETVPYLYRYLVPILCDTPAATDWLQETLADERRSGLELIGRRITGVTELFPPRA